MWKVRKAFTSGRTCYSFLHPQTVLGASPCQAPSGAGEAQHGTDRARRSRSGAPGSRQKPMESGRSEERELWRTRPGEGRGTAWRRGLHFYLRRSGKVSLRKRLEQGPGGEAASRADIRGGLREGGWSPEARGRSLLTPEGPSAVTQRAERDR